MSPAPSKSSGARLEPCLPWAHTGIVVAHEADAVAALLPHVEGSFHSAVVCAGGDGAGEILSRGPFCYVLLAGNADGTVSARDTVLVDEVRALVAARSPSLGRAPPVISVDPTDPRARETILRRLFESGRYHHGNCTPLDPAVHLRFDGERSGDRLSRVLVNDIPCDLQDAPFEVLLQLAITHIRGPRAWMSRTALHIRPESPAPTRIRQQLAHVLPEGFDILRFGYGDFRLAPSVTVEVVWEAYIDHPNSAIRAMAIGEMQRRR